MNFIVYVLESDKTGKKYIGFTKDINRRLKEHNQGRVLSTRNRGPWKVIYTERQDTRILARAREKFFKTSKGRRVLKNLV